MLKKLIGLPLGLAGTSVGFGIMGEAFNSQGLTDAGTAAGKFIAPAINITMGGELINQLKDLGKVKETKEKKKKVKIDFLL